jgi:hypothetical protein
VKCALAAFIERCDCEPINLRQRRGFITQRTRERGQRIRRAFDLDKYACARVADVTAEAQTHGQTVDERPEPDALYDPMHKHMLPRHG